MLSTRVFSILILLALASLAGSGCARQAEVANPFERSTVALDPADGNSWPANWATSSRANAIFAAFVKHAEASGDWLLLAHKGEAVYVRPADPKNIGVRYQGRSNKVEMLRVPGEVEVLSLRQYASGSNLNFESESARLSLTSVQVRRNPAFSY